MRTKGAKKLGAWLAKRGITQEGFADQAGCTGAAVCQWISGSRRPNVDSAFIIEAITDGAVLASDWRYAPESTVRKKQVRAA